MTERGAETQIGKESPPDFSLWHGTVKPTTVGEVTVTPPWFASGSKSPHTVVIEPAAASPVP